MIVLLLIFIIEGLLFFLLNQFFGFSYTNFDLISTIIIGINSIIYLFIISKYAKGKNEYIILLLAYFIRILCLYWDIFGRDIFVLPNSGADSEMYNFNAIQFSQGYGAGRGGLYSMLVGFIYELFGEQRILAQYFNLLLSIFTVLLLKHTTEILNLGKKFRLLVLFIAAFLPNFIVISSILLRESVLIFLITLSLYAFIRWWTNNNIFMFIISLVIPAIAGLFHSGAVIPALAYVLCYTFYNSKKKKYAIELKSLVAGIGFIIIFFIITSFFGDVLFSKFQGIDSISDATEKAKAYTSGDTAYLETVDASSLPSMILLTPVRMFYFIASPLPWDWRGLNDIFAFIFSSLIYLFSFLYVYKALRISTGTQRNIIISLLIMAISSALFFAWGVSNAGSALRHREKFLAIYIIMLAISLNSISLNKRRKYKRGDYNA